MKKMLFGITAVLLLFALAGCDFVSHVNDSGKVSAGEEIAGNDLKTTKHGYFFQDWDNNDGRVTLNADSTFAGNFTVNWEGNKGGWNYVCGLGLSKNCAASGNQTSSAGVPSSNKIISYNGNFEPEAHKYDDNTWGIENCLMTFYGWTEDCSIEYYVLEAYGEFDPSHSVGPTENGKYKHAGDFMDRNNTVFGIYYRYAGADGDVDPAPLSNKTDNFYQVYSVRRENKDFANLNRDTGAVTYNSISGTIYLADHIAAWKNMIQGEGTNYHVNTHAFQVLASEGSGAVKGYSNLNVSFADDSDTPVYQQAWYTFKNSEITGSHNYLSASTSSTLWAAYPPGEPLTYHTNRVDYSNDSTIERSNWMIEQVDWADNTAYYNIKTTYNPLDTNTFKYLSMRITDTDTDAPETDRYSNPVFTADLPPWPGFDEQLQQWSIEKDGAYSTLKCRARSKNPLPGDYSCTIGVNGWTGYVQGKPYYNPDTFAGGLDKASSFDFYEEWEMECVGKDYAGPYDPAMPVELNVKNKWSGKRLTVTSSNNDAETRVQPDNSSWASQDWIFERTAPYSSVYRIKNKWSGYYLNVRDNNENAKVACYSLVESWGSMQWIAETSEEGYRFKNVWSGKYLTVVDTSDYAEVLAKDLHYDWASQVWTVVE